MDELNPRFGDMIKKQTLFLVLELEMILGPCSNLTGQIREGTKNERNHWNNGRNQPEKTFLNEDCPQQTK